MTLTFLTRYLRDSKKMSKTAKNSTMLIAGTVSRRIIAKLCQWAIIDEKSVNAKERKLIKPDLLKSNKSVLKDGASSNNEANNITENMIILLTTKIRSCRWMCFSIFSNKPLGGFIWFFTSLRYLINTSKPSILVQIYHVLYLF